MFSADWPAPKNIKTRISTRENGVSLPPWNSLNLATHVDDKLQHVKSNREIFQKDLPSPPLWLNQQHTKTCLLLTTKTTTKPPPIADASYTQISNVICSILTADCLPLLICDQAGSIVSAIHAGWKGLADGIIEESVRCMLQSSGVSSDSLLVWLGPAISKKHFEVGVEVKKQFTDKYPSCKGAFTLTDKLKQKYLCNLYHIATIILNSLGVTKIYGSNFCTYSDEQRFFSYRRDGVTGRIASLIWIED